MTDQNDKNGWYVSYAVYSVVGIQLAVSVIAGLFFGNYIDKKIGTAPWLTIVGLVLGSAGGFYNLFKIMNWHRGRVSK
jgi:ATP synthase protein I